MKPPATGLHMALQIIRIVVGAVIITTLLMIFAALAPDRVSLPGPDRSLSFHP